MKKTRRLFCKLKISSGATNLSPLFFQLTGTELAYPKEAVQDFFKDMHHAKDWAPIPPSITNEEHGWAWVINMYGRLAYCRLDG